MRKGTPRHRHLKHDAEKVTKIITEGENSISPLSIGDILRLRKYHESSRPILVRLTSTIDVSLLLSKERSLPKDIRIKSDTTREERLTESLLLKERWSLIQAGGIDHKAIRIWYNKIFVQNKLHGQIIKLSLFLFSVSLVMPIWKPLTPHYFPDYLIISQIMITLLILYIMVSHLITLKLTLEMTKTISKFYYGMHTI